MTIEKTNGTPSLTAILDAVCLLSRTTSEDIVGPSRSGRIMLARLAYYRAASVYGYSGPKIATSVNRDNGTVHHGKSTNKVLARQLADAVVDYLEGETVTPPELPDAMPSAYFGPGTMMPAELRARLREEERMARQRDLEKNAVTKPRARVSPFPPGTERLLLGGVSMKWLKKRYPNWVMP